MGTTPLQRAGESASPDGRTHETAPREHGKMNVKSGFEVRPGNLCLSQIK
ncbi:hypothetical protein [Paenibacillus sp. A14]